VRNGLEKSRFLVAALARNDNVVGAFVELSSSGRTRRPSLRELLSARMDGRPGGAWGNWLVTHDLRWAADLLPLRGWMR